MAEYDDPYANALSFGDKPTSPDAAEPDPYTGLIDFGGSQRETGLRDAYSTPGEGGRTPEGLYHYRTKDGTETFSKEPPPADAKLYHTPSPNEAGENTGFDRFWGGKDVSDPFVEGVGQSFMKTGRGSKQLALDAMHGLGMISDAQHNAYNNHIDEMAKLDKPLEETTGGKVGNFAGSAAQTWAIPGKILAQTLGQGAFGGLQPVEKGGSRLLNTGVSAGAGLIGSSIASGLSRLVQPVRSSLTEGGKEAVTTLLDAGVPLDVAQSTGSKAVESAKLAAGDNPFINKTSLPIKQAAAFTKAALRTVGEEADEAAPEVIKRASERIGDTIGGIAERNPINISTDKVFGKQMDSILAEANVPGALADHTKDTVNSIGRRLLKGVDQGDENFGLLNPKVTAGVRRTISDWSQSGDSQLRYLGGRLAVILDDAIDRSAELNNPGDAQILRQARNQFMNLDKLTDPNVINQQTRHISPTALFNKFKNTSTAQMGSGPQDLWTLARAGAQILPDKVGNSGTARRLAAMGGMGLLGAAGGALFTDDPKQTLMNAAKFAALGITAPWSAQKFNESPWIRDWVMQTANSPAAKKVVEGMIKTGGAAGATAARNLVSGAGGFGDSNLTAEERLRKHQAYIKESE